MHSDRMELPPYDHHHHSRYVPHPPTPNFSADHRTFYPQHHLPPPPPLPPLPRPSSYGHLPPPPPHPPYNPHQSQFTFHEPYRHHPIEDDPRRTRIFDSPRVSDRSLFEIDRPAPYIPELRDPRPDSWVDPPRVPPDGGPLRLLSRSLHHQPTHHHIPFTDQGRTVSPYGPSDNFRFEVERNYRSRDDFSDVFRNNTMHNEENPWGQNIPIDDDVDVHSHNGFIVHSGMSSSNFKRDVDSGNASNHMSSQDFLPDFGNFESSYGSVSDKERFWHNRDENRRWPSHEDPVREVFDPSLGMKSNNFDYGDGITRRVPHVYDSGKFNTRGREGREELSTTPRKQPRKSALLRIQLGKPSYRNRNLDQHFSKVYSENSNTGFSRIKDYDTRRVHSDRRIEVEREGSPVELDVSFKSNSLVAKAIMAPSAPVDDSNRILTPRNRKIRKITSSDSPTTKFNVGSVESDIPIHGSDCPSTTVKSPKKVGNSANLNSCDIRSEPCSNGVNGLTENSPLVESQNGLAADENLNTVCFSGSPSAMLNKKKKVARPISFSLKSLSIKNGFKPVKTDGSKINLSAESHTNKVVLHSEADVVSDAVKLPSPTGELVDYVDKSPKDVVLQEDSSAIVSDEWCEHTTKRKHRSLSNIMAGKDLVELRNRSRVDVGERTCLNGVSREIENNHAKGNSEHLVFVGGSGNAGLPSSGAMEVHEGPADKNVSVLSGDILLDRDCEFIQGKEAISLSDVDSIEVGFEQLVPGNRIIEGSSNANFTDQGNDNTGSSNEKKRKLDGSIRNTCSSNCESSSTSSANSGSTNSQGKGIVSNASLINEEANVLLEAEPPEGSPDAIFVMKNNPDTCSGRIEPPKVNRKRKVRNSQLFLSNPSGMLLNEDMASAISCSNAKDFVATVDQATGSATMDFHVISQPYDIDNNMNTRCSEVDASHRGGDNVGPTDTSPKYKKKGKTSVQGLPLSTLSDIQEEPTSADNSTSSLEVFLNSDKVTTKLEETTAVVSADAVHYAGLPGGSKSMNKLTETSEEGEIIEDLVGDGFVGECSKFEQADQEENSTSVMAINYPNNAINVETGCSEESAPVQDAEYYNYQLVRNDCPSVSNNMSMSADGDVSTTNSDGGAIDSAPESVSKLGLEEHVSIVFGSKDSKLCEKHVSEGGSVLSRPTISSDTSNSIAKSGVTMGSDVSTKSAASFISKGTNGVTQGLNGKNMEPSLRRNQLISAVPRIIPNRSSPAFTASKIVNPLSQISKPRTWHRMGSTSAVSISGTKSCTIPVPPQKSTSKVGKAENSSYVRKGNSLVRKPSPVNTLINGSGALSSSVYRQSLLTADIVDKRKGPETRVDVNSLKSFKSTGGSEAISVSSKTPLLPDGAKSVNCTTTYAGGSNCSPLGDPSSNVYASTTSDILKSTENMDLARSVDGMKVSAAPENRTDLKNNSEILSEQDDGNLTKKMVYVKRKSNQLVAASNAGDQPDRDLDKSQSSAEYYYKRKRNQLIRSLAEDQVKGGTAVNGENLGSEAQKAPNVILNRSVSKRQSAKGSGKLHRPSKFHSVWTLYSRHSSDKDGNLLRRRKVWPQLFPWKRATNWKFSLHNPSSVARNSASTIRRRNTIYTRSANGFSLRKSKVLSVGGASLKWSKSIERNSKRANEEATLAVAAAEKRKREQNGSTSATDGTKSRYHSSRERIFRIGSVRYKMDRSRRTLQRISDEEPSCSAALKYEKNAKKSYVPRRLVIGNDEYVRIGNGNQLIRDPKKRTRLLASEKVRWSLHTARLRLAKRKKYCQFFTRFGKCNKDDGKCPYIHDPSKIAVCTKFLKRSCSNPNCKLTHKVIPERMQDCSYFLQGLCSNEHCPYRHVNVNPNASVCEGFLRGYCADGDECRKKHTYVCPVFEATGICPQGSECKLHHPKKNRKRGKKREQPSDQNSRGRYFGSGHIDFVEFNLPTVTDKEEAAAMDEDDIFMKEGKFADYISLAGFSEEEEEEDDRGCDLMNERMLDSELSDVEVSDSDELMKPVCIMKEKNLGTESGSAVGSPGVVLGESN